MAKNARAFNTWLVKDWLRENNYPFPNVAVFDFYNVLTGENNHHRYNQGTIEYITDQGKDTSAYPTNRSDDHPSAEGNRKATLEFVPLLNVYYHLWKGSDTSQTQTNATPESGGREVTEMPTEGNLAITATTIEDTPTIPSKPTAEQKGQGSGVCPGIGLIPLPLIGLIWLTRRTRNPD